MGEPFKILDLAKKLILLAGLEPEKDIEIQFTGTRPGEKLFEDLSLQAEQLIPTAHPRILSAVPLEDTDADSFNAHLQELKQATNLRDQARTILLLRELVPDYTPSAQLLKEATLSPGILELQSTLIA